MEYVIWLSCLRVGIRPPGIPATWDEMTNWQRALLIAFEQTHEYEDQKAQADVAKAYWG